MGVVGVMVGRFLNLQNSWEVLNYAGLLLLLFVVVVVVVVVFKLFTPEAGLVLGPF